ncbi:hypothetical protein J5A73_07410 [Leptotrichia sp. oral taxon 218]|uniref:hypothetical protein n=1 Tax=Leptotrichia sp. oral taxon 218 TaxID=712361 RepID=UPI001B8C0A17|nr:hypothetical protein [Leptotrichia sp. oral taxon 218]QUB94861.1 hypothetical protein J5A73_07410 [Leptotrichia sp. oral taxon 218]
MKKILILLVLLGTLQGCSFVDYVTQPQRFYGWKPEGELKDEWEKEGYPHWPMTCYTDKWGDRWCKWGYDSD